MRENIPAYAAYIKDIREQLRMSQEEFANKCGHTSTNARSWTSKLESGKIKLSLNDVETVAAALSVSPVDLVCLTESDNQFLIETTPSDRLLLRKINRLSDNGKQKLEERIDELLKLEGKE